MNAEIYSAIRRFEAVRAAFGKSPIPYSEVERAKIFLANAVLRYFEIVIETDDVKNPVSPVCPSEKTTIIPEKQPSFVYLIQNSRNGLFKIGISSQPAVRERTLQSEEPELKMLFYFPGSRKDESALHAMFANTRVRGEWFRLTSENIYDFISFFEKREDN